MMTNFAVGGRLVTETEFNATMERQAKAAGELERADSFRGELQPLTVLQLAELVQLALKHPRLSNESVRATGQRFLGHVRAHFADCPSVLAVLDADARELEH